jgi:lipopolysaccharide transport system ATP-binding protein
MPAPVISVENLSKSYLVGHRAERDGPYSYTSLRDVIAREMHNSARKAIDVIRGRQVVQGDAIEEFWALKDVGFEVQQGEVLGIIGRNGAGKSTLLKILSRITEPTAGRITLRGRVASLLEVGTGFHPELTGRENIYLNGAILGMSRAEIRKKFDEIVAFAEVERFLDTPVKRYSSGMYVRLAFAVAAHLEPEILVVDEVLAVGDAEFQKKCLGKMDEVSRREGRTVLVVSHNMGVVSSLCGKALWLDRGAIHKHGNAGDLIGHYLTRPVDAGERMVRLDNLQRGAWLEDDRVRLTSLEWLTPLPLQHGQPASLRLHLRARAPVSGLSVLVGFNCNIGTRVLTYHMDAKGSRQDFGASKAGFVTLHIDSLGLGPDFYGVDVALRSGDFHFLDMLNNFSQVQVVAGPETSAAIARGLSGVRLEGDWVWDFEKNAPDVDDDIQLVRSSR